VVADPNTAGDQPSRGWIYRSRILVSQNGVSTPISVMLQGDIRSGRKLDDGECYLVLNNTAELGTSFTVAVSGIVRQLWLLP